ncbi:uncharacterized protein [Eurosta solidaginis]|uniref:uncharacterized protein isoform X2 n=1 Tax=Eurosta solidaginis TaxID=178769 RepID=UPI0035306697
MYMATGNNRNHNVQINGENIQQTQKIKWLGRTINTSLSIKDHVKNIKNNTKSAKNLLNRLTTIKAGLAPAVGLNIYKTFIRSKMEYASTSYANAPKSFDKQLQTIANESLRRCLGVPPNTPTLARYALACELPPIYRATWLTSKELIKQWYINSELKNDLENGTPINSSYSHTYNQFKHIINRINTNVSFTIHNKLTLTESELGGSKNNITNEQLKGIYYEKLTKLHSEDYITISTDASVSDTNTGCAVYDIARNVSFLFNINDKLSSTTGELIAILQAVELAHKNNWRKTAIFTDSLAAIKLLKTATTQNYIIANIHNLVAHSNIQKLTITWVPSHVGIKFNEKADISAKTATTIGKNLTIALTPDEALMKIEKELWTATKQEIKTKCTNWDDSTIDCIASKIKKPWFKSKKINMEP